MLGEDTSYPVGHFLKHFEAGSKAAFQLTVLVPGEPDRVKWNLSVKGVTYELVHKK